MNTREYFPKITCPESHIVLLQYSKCKTSYVLKCMGVICLKDRQHVGYLIGQL